MVVFPFKSSSIEGLTRLDPEYYQPQYYQKVILVRTLSSQKVKDIFTIELGQPYSSNSFNNDEGIKISKIGDVTNRRDILDWEIINNKEFIKFGARQIQPQDILITMTGDPPDVGKVYMPYTDFHSQSIITYNQRIAKLKSKHHPPFFLYAVLSTEYFRIRFEQCALGIRQRNVSIPDLKNASVFIPNDPDKIKNIAEKVREHFRLKQQANEQYSQAIQLLERELGLDEVDKNFKIFNTIYLSSVTCNNRVDAQCYKPEYVLYEKFLRKKGNFDSIGSLMVRATKGHQQEPTEKGSIPYVSIKDIKGVEVIAEEKCGSAPVTSQINDLLLAVTGATIGKTGINYRYDNLAFCGDLLNLEIRAEKVSPEYLLMILKSPVGQTQITRWITGSTNGHFAPTDLKKVLIPRLNPETENQISVLMKQSLMNKDQSEHLLAQAKSEVETLIEQAAQKA